jgi:hypothetical protein
MDTRSWLGFALLVVLPGACGGSFQVGGDGGDAPGDGRDGDGRADVRDARDVPPIACDFDPHCDQPCVTDPDCGANLFCGPDGLCRAECTPGGSECGATYTCERGRCIDECPSVVVDTNLVTPTVMLLIDQSGSMDQDFEGMQRWAAVEQALTDPATGVLPALETQVVFGATLYTSHNGNLGGEACPLLQVVDPALNNAAAIGGLLSGNGPDGDTPTGESITPVATTLMTPPPGPGDGPRIIVLATDGEPDTCAVPNPQTGQPEAVAAAQAAYTAGVRMFVLSVGSDVGAAHLQDMANAGAGLPIGGPTDARYYIANNPAELTAAFGDIIHGVRSCTFMLDGVVAPADWGLGDVQLDGTPLVYSDPNGWTLSDGSTLVLQGTACSTFLEAASPVLTAVWPCGTIIT